MRKNLRFFASLMAMMLAVGGITAQTPMPPQLFTYQAVVRDGSNHIVRNSAVGVKITIMQTDPNTGTQVYQETHTPTTNVNGAFTVIVGNGTNTTGTIAAINWSNGPYYLVSQIDINNDLAYDITTTQQLVSVPYALYCGTCANGGGGGSQGLSDVVAVNNSANNNQLKNLKDPTDPQDAMTKRIIDSITHRYDSILAALTACCGGGGSTPCAASAGTVNISGTSAICSGAGTTLTASATGNRGTLTYQWKKDGVDLPGETNATYTATAAGNYTVVVTATDGTCTPTSATANASLNVTVGTAPVLTWNTTPAAVSVCSGSNTTLTANVTADGGETVTYTWTPATGLNTTTGASVTATPTTTTTYTVTASATSATGCPVNENKTVTVTVETPNLTLGNILYEGTPSTTASFTTGVNKTFAANISTQSGTGRLGYAWSTSQGGAVLRTTSSITVNEANTGSMTLWLRVYDTTASGCTTYKDKSIDVTVTAECSVTLGNVSVERVGGSSTYTNLPSPYKVTVSSYTPGDATITYRWYRKSSPTSPVETTPSYVMENTGNCQIAYYLTTNASTQYYFCDVTVTSGTCTQTKTAYTSAVVTSYNGSGSLATPTVTASGSTVTVSATVTNTTANKNKYLCVTVVPKTNTEIIGSNNPVCLKDGYGSTDKSVSYTFTTTPPPGTVVAVYYWYNTNSTCTNGTTGTGVNVKTVTF